MQIVTILIKKDIENLLFCKSRNIDILTIYLCFNQKRVIQTSISLSSFFKSRSYGENGLVIKITTLSSKSGFPSSGHSHNVPSVGCPSVIKIIFGFISIPLLCNHTCVAKVQKERL